jgi:tyrosyl-tRNA synthetase
MNDPRWAVFMEDDEDEVGRIIRKAFCPPEIAQGNPCLEYIEHIVLPWFGKFEVARKEEDGGNKTFMTMEELTVDYESGALHPSEVKLVLARALNMVLQPVRDHFRNNGEAKTLVEEIFKYYVKAGPKLISRRCNNNSRIFF